MNVHVDALWEALDRTLPCLRIQHMLGLTATCTASVNEAFGGPHTFCM